MTHNLKADIAKYYRYWFGCNDVYETWAKKHGLTSNALFLLQTIYENPKTCTQHLICEKLLLPKQTINTILDGFENKGYVKRIPADIDKRSKYVVFTELGEEYVMSLMAQLELFEEAAFLGLSEEQRETLVETSLILLSEMKRLLDQLE